MNSDLVLVIALVIHLSCNRVLLIGSNFKTARTFRLSRVFYYNVYIEPNDFQNNIFCVTSVRFKNLEVVF